MDRHDVIIIGAGPSALALAASLQSKQVNFRIFDGKGVAGGAYNDMYADMQLASPAKYVSLPGLPLRHDNEYIKAGDYLNYLQRYARHFALEVEKYQVSAVTPLSQGRGFDVQFDLSHDGDDGGQFGGSITAQHLVLATGMFDSPRYSNAVNQAMLQGDGPRIIHAHDWRGADQWLDKKVLIQGCATSAVEIAEAFASIGQAVSVTSRGRRFNSLPQRLLGRDIHDLLVPLAKLPTWMLRHHCKQYYSNDGQVVTEPATHKSLLRYVREGKIRLLGDIERIAGKRVYFKDHVSAEFDLIICATGYTFNYDYLHFGLSQHKVLDSFSKGESKLWPGLYIMGKSCIFGRPSQFIWGIAHDAPLLADAIAKHIEISANAGAVKRWQ